MRLQELFESTEEDRAIISLSLAVYAHLKKYSGKQPPNGKPINVGTIGELFDTPINILDPVEIQVWSNEDVLANFPRTKEEIEEEPEDTRTIVGFWDSDPEVIVFNADYLDSNTLKSAATHELRHALDDYKSGFYASASKSYDTPRKKEHRKDYSKDKYASDLVKKQAYHAKPAEINARFAEVLHALSIQIAHIVKKPDSGPALQRAIKLFKHLLASKHIAHLFPEKEKSRDYKRLMKRGVDFIQKEIAYLQSQK
jgi:hypothetical protein